MKQWTALAAALAVWTAVGEGQLQPSPPHRAIIQDIGLPAIDRGLRAQDPPRAARSARRRRPRLEGRRRSPPVRAGLDHRQVQERSGRLRPDADPDDDGSGSGCRGDAATARCRIRAGALPQPRDGAAQRPDVRESMELPRHRHGARVGHSTRRDQRHHRGRARQRHGVSLDHGALQRALPVSPHAERSTVSSARSGGRALCRRAGARPERVVSIRRAARLHLERRTCRSISMATARTWPAPLAS